MPIPKGCISIIIKKKFEYSETWKRFVPVDKILLDVNSPIKTEAQLANYIYQKHGVGRYMLLAWERGHEGFWVFWLGFIMENGFIRDINKNKELKNLKQELIKTKDFDEREIIEEEMDMVKDEKKIEKSIQRRGPTKIIKFRPGIMHPYMEF